MGTRADFYVGADEKAEWLGSIAYDGYRIYQMMADEALADKDSAACWAIKTATTPDEFRKAVADLLALNDDATTPDQGWPWPWEDSNTTDFAYCLDADKVRTFVFGGELMKSYDPDVEDNDDRGPGIPFPNMKDRQNVTYGERSGAMFIGLK